MSKNDDVTPYINQHNIDSVRSCIQKKLSNVPFHSTITNSLNILTDIDHFPYTRFYRGVYLSENPVVFERESGWRPRYDNCYKSPPSANEISHQYPNHCFEGSCRTTLPCYKNS